MLLFVFLLEAGNRLAAFPHAAQHTEGRVLRAGSVHARTRAAYHTIRKKQANAEKRGSPSAFARHVYLVLLDNAGSLDDAS